ncbi:MAG: RluA family pseudouridine synthase [Verrucomicrobia bacterium]|nr:RluA family pseudouridine synthase [Verrucomicrobiota bacterium]
MAKTSDIQLGDGTRLLILYEDRAVLAIDKPVGWMLAPNAWDRTPWNLQLALESSLRSGAFWARCRNLRFLRFVHRLDADTSGVLLLAKSQGALRALGQLFETRQVKKSYLAVVQGVPREQAWDCALKIGRDPRQPGRMTVNGLESRAALTQFQVLEASQDTALVLAQPETGRMHQLRVHLAASGHPILGDGLYAEVSGQKSEVRDRRSGAAEDQRPKERILRRDLALALRAVGLAYPDPFTRRWVRIEAPCAAFLRKFGFQERVIPRAGFAVARGQSPTVNRR